MGTQSQPSVPTGLVGKTLTFANNACNDAGLSLRVASSTSASPSTFTSPSLDTEGSKTIASYNDNTKSGSTPSNPGGIVGVVLVGTQSTLG